MKNHLGNILCVVLLIAGAGKGCAEDLLGFDDASSRAQRGLEKKFDASLKAEDMDAWLKHMSAKPHHAGSIESKQVAEFIAEKFEAWGYEVEIAEYQILLPTPVERELELIAPIKFKASLREDSLKDDASSSVRDNLLPPYNAFSVDGEVEGELVFVNYGIPEDYEILERNGISVKGKIAIAKYGKSWRGIKPKLAGEKGAIGTILYSDPADDGYAAGDVYPKGPFKHESGVQRGSVMDMPTYPGDVLTPGVGATKDAKRLAIDKASTITKIPVIPISHRDALPLLAAMGGAVVPPEWSGALPITYHFGPGPARVRLKVKFSWDMITAYNVIAKLEGSKYPDEWVIRGNHHDGWNHGANDPLSGQITLMAEAKAIGELAKAGKRPLRTIIYAAWDVEEPGLIGSTEWAEHHGKELKEKAVAYLNSDGNSRGFVRLGGSHVLERFFNQIMEDVKDPRMDISVKDRRRAYLKLHATNEKLIKESRREDLRIYPLGSGSDYTPFLQHLGIASANMGFGGEAAGGSYHTLYDTYEHHIKWNDPGLLYGVTLSQLGGRATLRLANAPRLPFEFRGFSDNIELYVTELEELADTMRKTTEQTNEKIDDGTYAAALDPNKTLGPPKREKAVPHFNFAPLKNALGRLQTAADAYEAAVTKGFVASEKINELLYTSERLLTRDEGLKGRKWYKHHIYAPGFYTGYGVKTIPGVREAIEQREYKEVAGQVEIAAQVIDRMSERIEAINKLAVRK
ncbi:MAG: transferrin receptor-like dimerization domain-containing protein [Verrucomicrobiota bacterium]